jgi:imidazole glycerol-phosphate synthase subunit HisF
MDLRTRLIPCLQVRAGSLIKTKSFGEFGYIGDPANTCRIFNECEVDELAILDVRATHYRQGPDFRLLREIADECFMPVAYGGGLTSIDQVERILRIGIEKVIIGSAAYASPTFVSTVARAFGSQCIVAAIDVARDRRGGWQCKSRSGTHVTGHGAVEWARRVEDMGVGEILLTSIDFEGTWSGLDHDLIREVSRSVSVPVIAHGGANSKEDVVKAVRTSGASAVALGNMVVYQKKDMGVLVNFPTIDFGG